MPMYFGYRAHRDHGVPWGRPKNTSDAQTTENIKPAVRDDEAYWEEVRKRRCQDALAGSGILNKRRNSR